MPHIIQDAEFKTYLGDGLWPGMWVHNSLWLHPRQESTPLDVCYLWRVEQHDGVMVLAGQGINSIVPLTHEIADMLELFKHPSETSLAEYPEEWAALRKLGWGVHLCYEPRIYAYQTHIMLQCHKGYRRESFWLPEHLRAELSNNPEIMRTFLKTAWWKLKHPKYAEALARQQSQEFWHWPNTPDSKQLHQMGMAAWRTEEGKIEILPNGKLKATGRKTWDMPLEEDEVD
jgi:hypothetical protein